MFMSFVWHVTEILVGTDYVVAMIVVGHEANIK